MKRLNIILSVLIIAAAGLTFSCQQAIGASWYSRSGGSRGVQRNLTVKSRLGIIFRRDKSFSRRQCGAYG